MPVTPWQGWSAHQEEVDDTRVLAGLLASVQSSATTKSAQDVIDELKITTVEPHRLVYRLIKDDDLFQDDMSMAGPGTDLPLLLTPAGREVLAQFRDAQTPVRLAQGARRALLRWLSEIPETSWPHSRDILSSPHSWFFGVQFTAEQLAAAANNLIDRGYVKGGNQTMGRPGRRIEMAARGTTCVERFNGDPDEMEAHMAGTGNVNIGTFNQSGGNNAFASTVGSQTSTTNTLTLGQSAKDLVALLRVIREQGGIPEDEFDEADDIENALGAGAEGSDEAAAKAIGRAARFFHRLGKFAQPATQSLLTAAGNYAALRLGMAPQ
jgi:hypothetical protein